MMRIITGSARGTHLFSLQGDNTRPTSERAKEAVFSMLGERVVGTRVLDLFAGSGQMGLEALSRGACRRRTRGLRYRAQKCRENASFGPCNPALRRCTVLFEGLPRSGV